ncbi:MAG: putative nucleotidyltransferase with HDIG domain [bacterium]|jgi:putative nucleotidyltransferase with HDIG domain
MSESSFSQYSIVDIYGLTTSMKIKSYTEFSEKFKPMDSTSCKWLQHNFRGTKVRFYRDGKRYNGKVAHLKSGDSLIKLHDIPVSLSKLIDVTEGLIKELKKRGFYQFEVEVSTTQLLDAEANETNSKEVRRQHATKKANEFVQKVRESEKIHSEAANAMENILHSAKRGKINTEEVKKCIDSMLVNNSTEAMTAIANLKVSDRLFSHCVDVGVIFHSVYTEYLKRKNIKSAFPDEKHIILAGFLHDFGMSQIAPEIVDSGITFEFGSKEMDLIQSHTDIGATLLQKMGMPDIIVNIAKYHHVKLDSEMNSSHPKNVDYQSLPFETQLMAIVNQYQPLVGRREHKKSWPAPAAIRYLDALADIEYDLDVWEDFMQIIGTYPKSSLVELSNGSQAFVMSVPKEDLDCPQVAVICDSQGKRLEHHTLIDLEEESELHIARDLDHYEVFGDEAMEIFMSLQIK